MSSKKVKIEIEVYEEFARELKGHCDDIKHRVIPNRTFSEKIRCGAEEFAHHIVTLLKK